MIQEINNSLFVELIDQAKKSPRKRSHKTFHQSHNDPVQRIFIGLVEGTYVKPHKHPRSNIWEMLLGLKGRTGVLIFDDNGVVLQKHILAPGKDVIGLQIEPNTWHTVFPVDTETIMMEIKEGPFIAEGFAEFVDWAPDEGSDEASRFLDWAQKAEVGDAF